MTNTCSVKGVHYNRAMFTRQISVPVVCHSVCPICFTDAYKRKTFYCSKCALQREATNSGQTIELLLKKLSFARQRRLDLNESVNKLYCGNSSDATSKINDLHMEIAQLKAITDKLRNLKQEKLLKLTTLRNSNKDSRLNEMKHGEKFNRAVDNIRSLESKISEARSHMTKGNSDLSILRWRICTDLMSNVIPIARIESQQPSNECSTNQLLLSNGENENLIAMQLAEAQRWAYMNGQWIEANPSAITPASGYKILTAMIPHDGSSTAYIPFAVDVACQGVTANTSETSFTSSNVVMSKDLAVGFSYMNQLSAALASVFNIFLPFPMVVVHKDLLFGRFSVEQFRIYAGRVSANIWYLCGILGLELSQLRPCNPAYNLTLALQYISAIKDKTLKTQPVELFASLVTTHVADFERLLDCCNAEAMLAGVAAPLSASAVDPSFVECLADEDEWVTLPGGVEHYNEGSYHGDSIRQSSSTSFMASTNPLLPSTITSALFSLIRGRTTSTSQS